MNWPIYVKMVLDEKVNQLRIYCDNFLVLQCSTDECVRELYSIQKRSVVCSLQFNETQLDDSFCNSLGFPPDNVRDCFNPDCLARWNTSSWSEVTYSYNSFTLYVPPYTANNFNYMCFIYF